jgi:hypothetical protein
LFILTIDFIRLENEYEEGLKKKKSAETIEELSAMPSSVDSKQSSSIARAPSPPNHPPPFASKRKHVAIYQPFKDDCGNKKKAPPPSTPSAFPVVGRLPSSSRINHQSLPAYSPIALPLPPVTNAQEVSSPDITTQDPFHPNDVFNQDPLSDSKPKEVKAFVQNLWTAINVSKWY